MQSRLAYFHERSSVEAMQAIIHAFHPEAKLPDDLQNLGTAYYSVLAGAGRALIVLDNASGLEQIKPLLPPPNCLLLVTSRIRFSLPGMEARNLDCLSPEKSAELLVKLAPRLKDVAADAAKLCGFMPLALEVFAALVNTKTILSPDELVRLLRERYEKLDPVEGAFQVSYDLLSDEQRRCWPLLAVFPASFDLAAAVAVCEGTIEPTRSLMQALVNANLIEFNETTDRFRLHDLARQFCEGRLGDSTAARLRHASHYQKLAAETDELYLKGGENILRGLALFDRERVNLEAAFTWLESRKDRKSAELLVWLVHAVAYTGDLRFSRRQRIRWLESQLKAARICLDRLGEGNALGNLGLAYADLGEMRKAIGFYEQGLVIVREIGDRRGEGTALYNSALVFDQLGQRAEAISRAEAALKIFETIEDPNAAKVRAQLNKWRGQ